MDFYQTKTYMHNTQTGKHWEFQKIINVIITDKFRWYCSFIRGETEHDQQFVIFTAKFWTFLPIKNVLFNVTIATATTPFWLIKLVHWSLINCILFISFRGWLNACDKIIQFAVFYNHPILIRRFPSFLSTWISIVFKYRIFYTGCPMVISH